MSGEMDSTAQPSGQFTAPNCQIWHQTLNEFRLNNTLCDVVIMDENGHTTPAHSCILAAASPVLKSTIMLKDTNRMLIGQSITLMIAGISVDVWKLLLEYLYLNTLVIPAVPGLLENILAAANMLGMKDLFGLIQSHVNSAGIALEPAVQARSLKITLAPTKPVSQNNKCVQTGDSMSGVRVVEASKYKETKPFVLQAFTSPQSVTQRAVDYKLTVPLKCRFCRMEFDCKSNLVEHVSNWCTSLCKTKDSPLPTRIVINKSSDGKVYRCINPECGQFFKTTTSMRKHSMTCILGPDTINPAEQLCDLPDGTIIYQDNADLRALEEGAIQQPLAYLDARSVGVAHKSRMYSCAHCEFTSKRERMAIHLAVHHGKRKPFSCKICGLRYGYYDSMRDHYVGIHTTSQFTCTECGKVFKRSIMLRRHHLYEHRREGKATFPCKGCGKKFKTLTHAKRHELYHNPTDSRRRYRCEECHKLFCTKQDLERHVTGVHTEAKQYQCSQCSYKTSRKFYMMQHEQRHGIFSGRFICMTCDKCFVNEAFFRQHLKDKNHRGADIISADEASLQPLYTNELSQTIVEAPHDSNIVYGYSDT